MDKVSLTAGEMGPMSKEQLVFIATTIIMSARTYSINEDEKQFLSRSFNYWFEFLSEKFDEKCLNHSSEKSPKAEKHNRPAR